MLVWMKSIAFVPVTAMLLRVNGSSPLVTVTVCEALVVPITWSAKVRLAVESETVGACNRMITPPFPGAAKSSLPFPLKSPAAR